jgi:CHAD domain-containing protein
MELKLHSFEKMTQRIHLSEYLKNQARAIVSLAPKVSRHPSGKNLHRLRVATRRARVVFWILRKSSSHSPGKNLTHDLRKLERALGNVRELDVAVVDAKHFSADGTCLKERRAKMQTKLGKLISPGRYKNLVRHLKKIDETSLDLKPKSLGDALDILELRLKRQLARDDFSDHDLHTLRIDLKRARYVLEALGRPIGKMKQLQDILGDAHDLLFLQEAIGKNAALKAKRQALNYRAIRLSRPVLAYAIDQISIFQYSFK